MSIKHLNIKPRRLAILGEKSPQFPNSIHVNRPTAPCRDKLFKRFSRTLDTNLYTNYGPLVNELEGKISEYLGVRNCVLVSNGTIGLQVLFAALKLKGEVIVPAYTFIATASALKWQGITPIFCDIDPITHNLCPSHCKQLISSKTSAILGVHLWGQTCEHASLKTLAERNSLALIFDAAHAFSCGDENQMIGGLGDAEVFSLHATKAFHTAEGGVITTNNDLLAEKLRKIINFGFNDYDHTDILGINGKMSELHAAIGLTNLESLNETLYQSKLVYKEYSALLSSCDLLTLKIYQEPHNFHYVVYEIKQNSTISRDMLIKALIAEGILSRKYFYPGCHRMHPFGSLDNYTPLPVTDDIASRCLVLPGGPNISLADVKDICEIILTIFNRADEVKKHLFGLANGSIND